MIKILVLSLISFITYAQNIKLNFVGDIMLDDGPGKYILSGKKPFKDFDHYLSDADYSIGNLECPVSNSGKEYKEKPVTFRANPKSLKALKDKFYALAVSNNHSGDYGRSAFLDTLKFLDQEKIKYFGGGENIEMAHQPLIIEKHGIKIAILGYLEFKPRSFEAGPNWAGIAWSENDQVIYDIKNAKKNGANIVIPFMHWGWEYESEPSERQIELAKLMIDNGADIVIGGHPHVTQKISKYKGKDIIWSLGNFLFDGFPEGPRRYGWLARLIVNKSDVRIDKIYSAHLTKIGVPKFDKEVDIVKEFFPIE